MKKKIKDCSEKEIFEAIFNQEQTSIAKNNCDYCNYSNKGCFIQCNKDFENCIDFKSIIEDVGEEEIEVYEDVINM